MTSSIPNPSFIIINSIEEKNYDLLQYINYEFPLASVYSFDSISAYHKSKEIDENIEICFLFENCLDYSNADTCENILRISSQLEIVAIIKDINYENTQQLLDLGICQILVNDYLTSAQVKQSTFLCMARNSKHVNELSAEHKTQFFDILSKHYGDLVITVDRDLSFQSTNKNIVKKLGVTTTTLSKENLRLYVHPEDLWRLDTIAENLLDKDFISIKPLRIKTATGLYKSFDASFFKNPNNSFEYVLNLKDFVEQEYKEDFRRENNERFSAIAEATNSIIYEFYYESHLLFTSNDNGDYGLIEADNLAEHIEKYMDRLHPDDRERVIKNFSGFTDFPSKESTTIKYRLRSPNGRYKSILDRYRIFFQNGVALKRIGARIDITEVTAQNALIALENRVYEMNADPSCDFCDVISFFERRMEELIPNSKCMVLTEDGDGKIESVSQRDHNNYFVAEIASHSKGLNPLRDSNAQRGKISENPIWADTIEVTDAFGIKYFWTSPATNKNQETIANILLFFPDKIDSEEIEESLVQRITILVGTLIAKHQALTETKVAKERYELVAKATNDTIWDWNVSKDILSWSKGLYEIFGYSPEQVASSSTWWFSHVHPEDSIRVSIKLYRFLEQKVDKWQDEYRFECADGTYRHVLDRGFMEKEPDGTAIRMIGAMQDITQSKTEEERLKLLSAAITQANDAVIITETPRISYDIPKIVYVNPAFSKMTGYLYEEVVGKSPSIFIGKNAMVEQQTILSKATEFNKEFIFEAINHRKNGDEYWARFSMIPVSDNRGEHSHWISIQSDISEQKEQEKEKEHLIQELTRHNNDLKQFSYITSHNLRAPLSNLIGLLNLVEDIVIEDEDLKEIIDGFSKSTHLLNQTVNDLIKIVIIKDNLSIEKEFINIQNIIQNILDQLAYTISQYSPIITINTENAPILLVNKPYIESIILNLLTNSLRYSSPDRILKIDITSSIIGKEIILIFKDNGIGIDLVRNADKLFGLYQRFHDYPDSKGLGLYLVKSQVLSMGGSISVESELGEGSSFLLTFKN